MLSKHWKSHVGYRLSQVRAVSDARSVKDRVRPEDFYQRAIGPLSGRGTWRSARCPFHVPDKHPSLRVNVETGAWRCMACGAHGGDILAFIMSRDGLSFRDAVWTLERGYHQ